MKGTRQLARQAALAEYGNDKRQQEIIAEKRCTAVKVLNKYWQLSFAGTDKENAEEFIDKLEDSLFCFEDLSDKDLLLILPSVLHGKAYFWFRGVRKDFKSFRDFTKAFKARFVEEWDRDTARQYDDGLYDELRALKQGKNENIGTYLENFKHLVSFFKIPPPFSELLRLALRNLRLEYQNFIDKKLYHYQDYRQLERLGRLFEKSTMLKRSNAPPTAIAKHEPNASEGEKRKEKKKGTIAEVPTISLSRNAPRDSRPLCCEDCGKSGVTYENCPDCNPYGHFWDDCDQSFDDYEDDW